MLFSDDPVDRVFDMMLKELAVSAAQFRPLPSGGTEVSFQGENFSYSVKTSTDFLNGKTYLSSYWPALKYRDKEVLVELRHAKRFLGAALNRKTRLDAIDAAERRRKNKEVAREILND